MPPPLANRPARPRLLVQSARRALTNGALATAEATARRARQLADVDSPAALDADELLVHVLAAAGKPLDALELGELLEQRMDDAGAPGHRRAALLVALARAAIAGGDHDAALAVAELARTRSRGRRLPGAECSGRRDDG